MRSPHPSPFQLTHTQSLTAPSPAWAAAPSPTSTANHHTHSERRAEGIRGTPTVRRIVAGISVRARSVARTGSVAWTGSVARAALARSHRAARHSGLHRALEIIRTHIAEGLRRASQVHNHLRIEAEG